MIGPDWTPTLDSGPEFCRHLSPGLHNSLSTHGFYVRNRSGMVILHLGIFQALTVKRMAHPSLDTISFSLLNYLKFSYLFIFWGLEDTSSTAQGSVVEVLGVTICDAETKQGPPYARQVPLPLDYLASLRDHLS